NLNSFDYPPDSGHPPYPTYETYSCGSCGNDSHFGYDCKPQLPLNYESEPGYIENCNSYPYDSQEEQKIKEDQATNARYWKILACYDDEDDYNFEITPNEPVDSLSMGDEHLNTILVTESDEFIKFSVENLVPNPSESEG
nr:hypothetical protein [Tanacetum cinerariifolium]